MNQFCKSFFKVFFAVVISLMLLLSYGLANQLHTLRDSYPTYGAAFVVNWRYNLNFMETERD